MVTKRRKGTLVLGILAATIVAGCKQNSPPTEGARGQGDETAVRSTPRPKERRLATFFGVDIFSAVPEKCESGLFVDSMTFETKACKIEDNDSHVVSTSYVTDNRFPYAKGRLWKVHVTLNRAVHGDTAAFEGYMNAFAAKYGELESTAGAKVFDDPQGNYHAVDKILLCKDSQSQCEEGVISYDGSKQYQSPGWQLARSIGRAAPDGSFLDISLTNKTLFMRMNAELDQARKTAAAAAVK